MLITELKIWRFTMKRWQRLIALLCVGVLLCALILTGCSDLFGSDDDESDDGGSDEPVAVDPPYHLTAEANKDGFQVLLTWNMDTGQEYDGFVVERGTASMNPQPIGNVGPATFAYGDNSSLPAGTYVYRVGAVQNPSTVTYCDSSVSVVIP